MQYTPLSMSRMNNFSEEIASADAYRDIRLSTTCMDNLSSTRRCSECRITAPQSQLRCAATRSESVWEQASAHVVGRVDGSVPGPSSPGSWASFSAVCWLFGKEIYDSLNKSVPIGLISNNWGGTRVEEWSSSSTSPAQARCYGDTKQDAETGDLFAGMINAYTVGPMRLKGIVFYQGEQNVGGPHCGLTCSAAFYSCQIKALITGWRAAFQNRTVVPDAKPLFFGFVQIAGYNYGNGSTSLAAGDIRQAQLAALELPNVGMSTAIDTGDFQNVHPPDKQTVANRLAQQALAMIYEQQPMWKTQFPIYRSAKMLRASTGSVRIAVYLTTRGGPGGNLTTTPPLAATQSTTHDTPGDGSVPRTQCVADVLTDPKWHYIPHMDESSCGFPTVTGADGSRLRANITVGLDRQSLILSVQDVPTSFRPVATSYGRGAWPVLTVFSTGGLPVIPWYADITANITDVAVKSDDVQSVSLQGPSVTSFAQADTCQVRVCDDLSLYDAQRSARQLKLRSCKSVEVVLCAGVHQLREPLLFGANDSNTTWRAETTDTSTVISASVPIVGWKPTSHGRVFTAPTPSDMLGLPRHMWLWWRRDRATIRSTVGPAHSGASACGSETIDVFGAFEG